MYLQALNLLCSVELKYYKRFLFGERGHLLFELASLLLVCSHSSLTSGVVYVHVSTQNRPRLLVGRAQQHGQISDIRFPFVMTLF